MHQFEKHFTVAEARALLPALRRLFKDVHARRDRARKIDAQLGERLTASGGDLGGKLVTDLLTDVVALNAELRLWQERGVVIKDFERGLVDFPSLRADREVFLCWELDEEDIEFFHDIDAGYAGRERL
ncbi:MAG: hypothetical protein PCFJNLEI_00038 [Verrucomicrobiae bacterium]|nr:hypothetical protein [Verrucomicrobiae bacterium]